MEYDYFLKISCTMFRFFWAGHLLQLEQISSHIVSNCFQFWWHCIVEWNHASFSSKFLRWMCTAWNCRIVHLECTVLRFSWFPLLLFLQAYRCLKEPEWKSIQRNDHPSQWDEKYPISNRVKQPKKWEKLVVHRKTCTFVVYTCRSERQQWQYE